MLACEVAYMHISLPGIPTIYNHKVFLLSFSLMFPARNKVPRILWMNDTELYVLFCGLLSFLLLFLLKFSLMFLARSKNPRSYYGWMIKNCMYYLMDFTVLSTFIFAFILSNVSCEEQSSQGLLWMDDTELYVLFH